MADEFVTLAQIALINDRNLADIKVTDLLDDAPLLARLAADVSSNGETHKYIKEIGAPVVGFRAANNGRENSKSTDTLMSVDLKIFDASFAVDKAVADIHFRGANWWIAREARRHLKASFFGAEGQLLYGTGKYSNGFAGLADDDDLSIADGDMVVDAGGDTEGGCYDVWLFRTTDTGSDVMAIGGARTAGRGFNIEMGETTVQRLTGATGTYPGYYTPISAWLGMQIGSKHSVGRIANLDNTKSLDDDLIAEALSLFPSSRMPNLIVTNRRGLKHLQQSRTATNATGTPAPFPTEAFGVPIVVTDSVPDDLDPIDEAD